MMGSKKPDIRKSTPCCSATQSQRSSVSAGTKRLTNGRPPQPAVVEPDRIGDRAYRMKLSKFFMLELLVGSWAAAAFTTYLSLFKMLVGPILFIHAVTHLGHLKIITETGASKILVMLAAVLSLGAMILALIYVTKKSDHVVSILIGCIFVAAITEISLQKITKRKIRPRVT